MVIKEAFFLVVILSAVFNHGGCSRIDWEDRVVAEEKAVVLKRVLKEINFTLPNLVDILESGGGLETIRNEFGCYRDLLDVLNGIRNLQSWAFSMVDSGTKLQSGILEGNLVDLGQYDECVAVKRPSYIGQHCLIVINIEMIDQNSSEYKTILSMTMAQCTPSTCSYDTVEKLMGMILSGANSALNSTAIRLEATVGHSDCHRNDRGPLATEDWVVTIICVIILVVAFISTAVDFVILKDKENPNTSQQVLRAFSIYTNGKKLFNTKAKGELMSCINGIKFLSMVWVVIGHKYAYTMYDPLVNELTILTWYSDWTKMLIVNATVSVDTFFMIAGLLNAYGFFTLVGKRKRYSIGDVLLSYLHRFIRLAPPYMMMMALTGTVLYRLGDGPLWDRIVGASRDGCQNSWWWNILFVNNYIRTASCVGQGWYLGADMQMFWLAPLVLYPMWKWPIFGMVELVLVFLVSIAIPFAASYIYGITSPFPLPTTVMDQQWVEMYEIYFPTHTRFQTYVVGIFAGYLLYKVRSKQLRLNMKPMMWFAGWIVAGILLLYSVFGGYWFLQFDNPYSQVADSFYISLFRVIWSVGVAWVVFACVTGHGGIVNWLLSLKVFWPLARLSYCTYLTHLAVIYSKTGRVRTAIYASDYGMVEEYMGDLLYSLTFAGVLSILLEAPTLVLEKMLFGDRKSQKKPASKPTTIEETEPKERIA